MGTSNVKSMLKFGKSLHSSGKFTTFAAQLERIINNLNFKNYEYTMFDCRKAEKV